jgi:hypothetical protein
MKAIEKTLNQIKLKAENIQGSRMPNLKAIKELLDFYGIKSTKPEYCFTWRERGCGIAKEGLMLTFYFKNGSARTLDTTDSYYSMNTFFYAKAILEAIKEI